MKQQITWIGGLALSQGFKWLGGFLKQQIAKMAQLDCKKQRDIKC